MVKVDFIIFYVLMLIFLITAVRLTVKYSRVGYWKMIDSILYISIIIFMVMILIGTFKSDNRLILLSLPIVPIFYIYINIITPRKTSIRVKFIESKITKKQQMNSEYLNLNERISRLLESKKLSKDRMNQFKTRMSLLLIFAIFVSFLRKIYTRGLNF
jgi:apolipoprotein N-acyltransferase